MLWRERLRAGLLDVSLWSVLAAPSAFLAALTLGGPQLNGEQLAYLAQLLMSPMIILACLAQHALYALLQPGGQTPGRRWNRIQVTREDGRACHPLRLAARDAILRGSLPWALLVVPYLGLPFLALWIFACLRFNLDGRLSGTQVQIRPREESERRSAPAKEKKEKPPREGAPGPARPERGGQKDKRARPR